MERIDRASGRSWYMETDADRYERERKDAHERHERERKEEHERYERERLEDRERQDERDRQEQKTEATDDQA
ncbi:MAG: hypothetical protein WCE80_15085 [Acidimicrobiia bacterium]